MALNTYSVIPQILIMRVSIKGMLPRYQLLLSWKRNV